MAANDFSKQIKNYRDKLASTFKENGFKVEVDKSTGFLFLSKDDMPGFILDIHEDVNFNTKSLDDGKKTPILKLEASAAMCGVPNLQTYDRLKLTELVMEKTGVFVKHIEGKDYMLKMYNYFGDEDQLLMISIIPFFKLFEAARIMQSYISSKMKKK